MAWFKKKKNSYLGIDIGTSAIKIVELEKDEGRYSLKNYGIYPLEAYLKSLNAQASLDVEKIANEEIAEMIGVLIKKANIGNRESFFSIPVYSSFSTVMDFPEISEKEIAAAVPLEAKKYVPIPIDEVILDWAIVSRLGKTSGPQVLLVAVPKEIINNYSQIARISGLKLNSLEAETFSLSRVLVGNDKSGVVLVDTGARSSNISIVDGGDIRITHNLEMGGLKLTVSISEQKKISQMEAENFKKGAMLDQDLIIKNVVNVFLDSIANRVKKVVSDYENKYERKLEKCILTGGGMQIPGTVEYFSKKLNIETSLGSPFARIVCPPELGPIMPELSSVLAVAVGAAMR